MNEKTFCCSRNVDCENIPLKEYTPVGGVALARFVRFNIKSVYGQSGGLKYFRTVSDGQENCKMICLPENAEEHY